MKKCISKILHYTFYLLALTLPCTHKVRASDEDIRPLPTVTPEQERKKVRKLLLIGPKAGSTYNEKTSTLNSIVNHLYHVKFDDNYRYQEARGDTKEIKEYAFNPPDKDYTLSIIDTPDDTKEETLKEKGFLKDGDHTIWLIVIAGTITRTEIVNSVNDIKPWANKKNRFFIFACKDTGDIPVENQLRMEKGIDIGKENKGWFRAINNPFRLNKYNEDEDEDEVEIKRTEAGFYATKKV
ncbi:MAG: hypothetical protein AAF335_00865 [Bacteroidota bacterium]